MPAPAATVDPTADAPFGAFEQKLSAAGYQPVGWKDVIDQCDFFDKKTNQNVRLDRGRLQKIADRRNKLVLSRESVSHFCIGHTKDDAPEWEQPPVAGLASRWRVGSYADGTPNLEAYSWEKPGFEGSFEKYPQRSAELFLNPDDINPIALLASTTPRRDLSLRLEDDRQPVTSQGRLLRIRCWKDADPIKLQFEDEDMADDMGKTGGKKPVQCDTDAGDAPTASPDDEVIQKVMNSDWGKKISQTLDKVSAFVDKAGPIFEELEAEAMGGEGGEGGAPPEGATPPAAGVAPPDAGAPAAKEEDEPPARNSMGSGGGYGNNYIPGRLGADRPPVRAQHYPPQDTTMPDHDARVRLQRVETEFRTALKAKDDEVVQLRADLAAIKLARETDAVNATLDELEREGFTVKRDVDLPHLVGLKPETRDEAIKFMRETRAKKDVTPVPGGGTKPIPEDQVLQPVRFSMEPGAGVAGDPKVATPAFKAPLTTTEINRVYQEARAKGVSVDEYVRQQQANGVKVM